MLGHSLQRESLSLYSLFTAVAWATRPGRRCFGERKEGKFLPSTANCQATLTKKPVSRAAKDPRETISFQMSALADQAACWVQALDSPVLRGLHSCEVPPGAAVFASPDGSCCWT